MTRDELAAEIPNHTNAAGVARAFGVTKKVIYAKVSEYGLSLDELKEKDVESPTPEEIAARAAEIRAGWSAKETRSRNVYGSSNRRWTPPAYESGDLVSLSSRRWAS